MFTHLNITSNTSFTTGEKLTGSTSGATATVESLSTVTAAATNGLSTASPGVVAFASDPHLKEGQQIKFSAINAQNNSTAMTTNDIFTVRNPSGSNTFELFEADGITPTNITSFTSAGNVVHGLVICSNVNGSFVAGETITGGTSGVTDVIQSDAVGMLSLIHI